MYSLDIFKKGVDEKAKEIQTSDLQKVNPDFYSILQADMRKLKIDIIKFKEKKGKVTEDDLGLAMGSIAAAYSFYMREFGDKEIATLHLKEIIETLEGILSRLNESNYRDLEKEFNDTLKLYDTKIKHISDTEALEEIIARFRYQIFKYKLREHIIDDSLSLNSILVYLVNDIDVILADPEVSKDIKDVLRKYVFDIDLIKENFRTVLVLVNLGLYDKKATIANIEEELTFSYYKESEIQKEYHEPSDEIKKNAAKMGRDLDLVFYDYKDDAKEYVPEVVIGSLKREKYPLNRGFRVLVSNKFKNVKYFIEGLIVNEMFDEIYEYRRLYADENPEYLKEFDMAFIAYRDKLTWRDLSEYILKTKNDFLINWLYVTNQDEELRKIFDVIPASMQRKLLERELSKTSDDNKKQEILLSFMREKSSGIRKDIFLKILEYKNVKLITSALDILLTLEDMDYTFDLREEFFSLLALIQDEKIKDEVLDYYFELTSNTGSIGAKLLHGHLKNDLEKKTDFQIPASIDNLNIFEAYQYSKVVSKSNALYFTKKHYKQKLDWKHIIEEATLLADEEFFPVVMYCYLGDKEYFINNVELGYKGLVPYLIENVPKSIVDLLCTLSALQISELDNSVLDIFAAHYEEYLASEKRTLNDQMDLLISSRCKTSEIKEFLAYVMHRGLLNSAIMSNFKKELFIGENTVSISAGGPVMIRAIQNIKDKFNRAGLVRISLSNRMFMPITEEALYFAQINDSLKEDFNFDLIFLTEKEILDMRNDSTLTEEVRDLQIRKYYGDLLCLMNFVPEDVKMRMAMQIARSGIEEFITYVKCNYPQYSNAILSYITDISLYNRLVNFNGAYTLEEALNVAPSGGRS